MKNGFNNSELRLATESFLRHKLDEKRATLRRWEEQYKDLPNAFNGRRRKAGEVQGLEEVLKFMIQNRK